MAEEVLAGARNFQGSPESARATEKSSLKPQRNLPTI
jgi:hypothetical protein